MTLGVTRACQAQGLQSMTVWMWSRRRQDVGGDKTDDTSVTITEAEDETLLVMGEPNE